MWRPGRGAAADPAFRAIPFPKVTEPICRLPLPTLFYRLEAANLGDLLRIWVRPSGKIYEPVPPIFKGRSQRTGRRKGCTALPVLAALLRTTRFRAAHCVRAPRPVARGDPPRNRRANAWLVTVKKKRKLSPGLRATSRSSVASPQIESRARWRNVNRLPFRRAAGSHARAQRHARRVARR